MREDYCCRCIENAGGNGRMQYNTRCCAIAQYDWTVWLSLRCCYYYNNNNLGTKREHATDASVFVVAAAVEVENLGADKWNDTYYPTGSDTAAVHKDWYIIDAEGQTLGRLASLAADCIRGKHSTGYTPSMDMGAFVVVVNADKVAVTGKKEEQKIYHRHTVGRPGGWKKETLEQIRARVPERIIEKAVKGMLPKGRLGNKLFHHLKVYKGASHPHEAQKPVDITDRIR